MEGAVPKKWAAACGLIGMLVCAPSPAAPRPQLSPADPGWEKSTSQWFEEVEPGGRVRVHNPFGDVYARFGGYEPRVEVLATEQRATGEEPTLRVAFIPADGNLDVRVERIGDARAKLARIDLVVFIPEGITLDAQTGDGTIEAKGIRGDVIANSVRGDISVRGTVGRVQLKTSRGKIAATLESGVTDRPQELITETGEIEVHLWEDADLDVDIATSGEISTDFSIDIRHVRFEEPGKLARATLGEGGASLALNSKRGRVRLFRLPRNLTAEE